MKLGTQVGLGPGHFVLDGNSAPHGKGHSSRPHFRNLRAQAKGRRLCLHPYNPRPMSIVAKRLDGSRCHLVRRYVSAQATGHIVLDGDPAPPLPPQKKNGGIAVPKFSAHVYCSQTVAHLSYCRNLLQWACRFEPNYVPK